MKGLSCFTNCVLYYIYVCVLWQECPDAKTVFPWDCGNNYLTCWVDHKN